jgi:hypothetical protein
MVAMTSCLEHLACHVHGVSDGAPIKDLASVAQRDRHPIGGGGFVTPSFD